MILIQAQRLAEEMAELLRPHCERVEIAGSIRRGKAEVKDIEIVCAPKFHMEPVKTLLESHDEQVDELAKFFENNGHNWTTLKDGERYKQLRLKAGIDVDLFIVREPAQWGVIFTLRTGPAEYSKWLVTARRHNGALPSHLKVQDGAVYEGSKLIPTPEEKDFFKVLGLEWVRPGLRAVPSANAERKAA